VAAIIVTQGPRLGDFYSLERGVNIIGRSPELPINLLDMTVSRRHMQIVWDPEERCFWAQDLGSMHGVVVDGVRLDQKAALSEGVSFSAGRVHLVFTMRDIKSRADAIAFLENQQSGLATINFTTSAIQELGPAAELSPRRRPQDFRKWAGADRTTLAIVFTDLISSTELASRLGNEAMNTKRRDHFGRVRSLVFEHGGYEIKSNGDGFMLAFRAAVSAVDFALGLCHDPGDPDLKVRVGAHLGPVVVEDEDVQGAAVSYAARLVDLAADGCIWVSAEIKGHLDQEKAARHADLRWRSRPGIELKGFPGPQELWTVIRRDGSS
jgi:class 3 adenylate cyclase